MKILSKLICILFMVSTAFAVDQWINYSNPFPIKAALPYGDGLLLSTAGGIRYRTNTADDLYTTVNGLAAPSISAVVISDLGTFAVSDNGIISTMMPSGSWQVLSRSFAGSNVRVIPGLVCLSGTIMTIAFEDRLSFFNLETLISILTIDHIADASLALNPISAMKVRGDSLFVAIDSTLYVRKMNWKKLDSDVQLYDQNTWKVVESVSKKGFAIKDFDWKDGKLKTFSTEGMRLWEKEGETVVALDTFSVFSSDAPYIKIRGKALKDSILYEKKVALKINGKDTVRHDYYQSKVRWVSKPSSGKAVLAGPQDVFYYDGKKLSDLKTFRSFAIGNAYELQALPVGGVLAASEDGEFSFNCGYDWSVPRRAFFVHANRSDAVGHDLKTLSVLPGGRVLYHIWGIGYFQYKDWGETLDSTNMFLANDNGYNKFCMDDFLEIPGTPYAIAVSTTPAPDNNGFFTTSASNKGYSLIYMDLKGNMSCAKNIGSAVLGGPMIARVDEETGKWVVYVGTRAELSKDADGALDVITFQPPKKTGGELSVTKENVKTYYGPSTTTPLDLVYEPKTDYFWMVTASSLVYWNHEQDSLRTPLSTNGLASTNFTSIDVDNRGNLWVGTSTNGAYRLTPRPTNPDTLSVIHFSTRQGMFSDRVQDVAVDSILGFVWFAHDNGISRYKRNDLRSSDGNMTDEARQDVKVFPNPFRPKMHSFVLFDNISEDAVINVYNRGGRLVKTISGDGVTGGRAEWDGKMDNGNLVAPGVYQYIIRGASKVKKGKLLIIH